MRFWVLTGLIFGMIFTSTSYSEVHQNEARQNIESKVLMNPSLNFSQSLSTKDLAQDGLIFTLTPFKDGQLILVTEKVACQDEACELVSSKSTKSEVILPSLLENQNITGGPLTYKINDQLFLMVSETADKRGHLYILSYKKNKEERVDLVLEEAKLKEAQPLAQL